MSGPDLRGLGPFAEGISAELRAKRSKWLAQACETAPEGWRLRAHLGRIADPAGRAAALAEFDTFGAIPRRAIIARYQKLERK
ncbi:hypothetical protein J2X36_002124 [Methylobacterium sp. BE186]|uniref:hypothetical protein n=1 Tax=Methylobacterium sp. BE186 TaxID=2817715 RepID=UPI0028614AE3|nr:hypothetical protein [Methylobacterium sp. BE186]MDR7037377.1 hypothetical protein [Methylobacterium sp. BE186]